MNHPKWVTPVFAIAALYDFVLGVGFLFAGGAIFRWIELEPPSHLGYIQFPAALLVVFAILFATIAANPSGHRNLIPFGILLKISYCGVVFFHWFTTGIPWIWKPFAIADLVFFIVFVLAWGALAPRMVGYARKS